MPTVSGKHVCPYYNKPTGCRYSTGPVTCRDLHVCQKFVDGVCSGTRCPLSHDLSATATAGRPKDVLKPFQSSAKRGPKKDAVAGALGAVLPRQRVLGCEKSTSRPEVGGRKGSAPRERSMCIYHLRGRCNYGDHCKRFHSKQGVPYQWQWRPNTSIVDGTLNISADQWTDFDEISNAMTERFFCDPSIDHSQGMDARSDRIDIDFERMTFSRIKDGLKGKVRRLGTPSVSTEKHATRSFLTLWRWYWQQTDTGNWMVFSDTDSDDIEQAFLTSLDVFQSTTGYWIDFGSMQRTTVGGGGDQSSCRVKRRPVLFILERRVAEELAVAKRRASDVQYPVQWSTVSDCATKEQFQLSPVANAGKTAAEFKIVADLFAVTLPQEAVKSIQRIQNMELWEDFSRHLTKLEKKRGRKLQTRQLFHGTSEQNVDAICQQGFDPRLAGMAVGAVYGKGSYFARDASFSKDYCRGSSKRMFLVQVIVGESCKGDASYARPPAKNPEKPLHQQELYDSCVDDSKNPSIFVVFHHDQAYAEYLIEF